MYRVSFDPETGILSITLEGFWSLGTLAKFTAELLLKVGMARLKRREFGILSDSTAFAIQSADVSAGFERIMAKGMASHTGPTAIVVAGQLNKMQAERTLRGSRLRVFLDMDEARTWLRAEMSRTETKAP